MQISGSNRFWFARWSGQCDVRVAYQVAPELVIADLTHEIEPYNIHDASYRLLQSVTYWPAGTVFVSVVDPGVGSDRRSVVAKLATGQLVLTPDNGTLTYLATYIGIAELRVINEATERLAGSAESHTFHGRDVYMYNAARLASGAISFEELGTPEPKEAIQVLPLKSQAKQLKRSQGRSIFSISALVRCGRIFPTRSLSNGRSNTMSRCSSVSTTKIPCVIKKKCVSDAPLRKWQNKNPSYMSIPC